MRQFENLPRVYQVRVLVVRHHAANEFVVDLHLYGGTRFSFAAERNLTRRIVVGGFDFQCFQTSISADALQSTPFAAISRLLDDQHFAALLGHRHHHHLVKAVVLPPVIIRSDN